MNEENTAVTKKYYDYISVGNRTKQVAYFVQQHDKNKMLGELLKPFNEKQILVIVKSKKSADNLHKFLKTQELKTLAIHGNHRASQIEEATKTFNNREINILITTDRILEVMNLENVELLVNYDLPLESPDYFKRLRLVDEIAESISLVNPEDENILGGLELMMKCEMLEVELDGFEHTKNSTPTSKGKTKKPRHKKVIQRAKR